MKVTDTKQIAGLQPVASGEAKRPAPAGKTAGGDRVSTDETSYLAAALINARQGAAGRRAEQLADIEASVRQGTYRPDPQRIAQEILDDAELAARLQALFGK